MELAIPLYLKLRSMTNVRGPVPSQVFTNTFRKVPGGLANIIDYFSRGIKSFIEKRTNRFFSFQKARDVLALHGRVYDVVMTKVLCYI